MRQPPYANGRFGNREPLSGGCRRDAVAVPQDMADRLATQHAQWRQWRHISESA
ncbi:hypothetical protein ACQPXS_02975 [Streptomyces sp. CA-142005]|uniref:hypothetical protein n=1 Tax=Streptomyces sp. CA-142005 TaxID=3240052 RepID=UPI003D8C286C